VKPIGHETLERFAWAVMLIGTGALQVATILEVLWQLP